MCVISILDFVWFNAELIMRHDERQTLVDEACCGDLFAVACEHFGRDRARKWLPRALTCRQALSH